jgi:DnaJ-class molecular chaperone
MSALSPSRLPRSDGRTSVRSWNTNEIRERISRSDADPIGAHIRILRDEQHCLACHGDGRVRFALDEKKRKACQCVVDAPDPQCWRCDGTGTAERADRVCVSCHGSRRETLTVQQIQNSANELMKYTCQALKQVDSISSDGSAGVTGIQVVFVDAKRAIETTGTSAARLMEGKE